MCGIGGFSLSEGSRINARRLSRALLSGLEVRGSQASGVAWQSAKGDGFVKAGVRGSKLDLAGLPKHADLVVLHTRYATHGSVRDNNNNHPVMSPDLSISLVHNGVIFNHDIVRSELSSGESLPDVDTSVIPALLQEFDRDLDMFSLLDGDAAVAWLDSESRGVLSVARVSYSPLWVAQVADGSFVFASTESILVEALRVCGLKPVFLTEVAERRLFRVRGGVVTAVESLPELDRRFVSAPKDVSGLRWATAGGHGSIYGSNYDSPYDLDTAGSIDSEFDQWLFNFYEVDGIYFDERGVYVGDLDSLREEWDYFARFQR